MLESDLRSPLVHIGETEAQKSSSHLPLSSSLGLDVIPGALAATLGHEATPRMDTTSQRGGASDQADLH